VSDSGNSDGIGQLVFLGTGTSHGIPVLGCDCDVCTSTNPKNRRTRSSVLLKLASGNILIDTSPEMRIQMIREGIRRIHAVMFTHDHADHLMGMDDLRVFPRYIEGPVPIHCEENVEERIRTVFDYAFDPRTAAYPAGDVPKLVFHRISPLPDDSFEPIRVLDQTVQPLRLRHGRFNTLGYRIGNVAYCTDVKAIPRISLDLLEGLDVFILDCLRYAPHVSHMNLEEALETIDRLRPKRTLLTHLCHAMDHETLRRQLPPGVEPAYDGLRTALT
jgi:phosphoribosyl 1,2-cyclic phosphate phosphodiesterase